MGWPLPFIPDKLPRRPNINEIIDATVRCQRLTPTDFELQSIKTNAHAYWRRSGGNVGGCIEVMVRDIRALKDAV